MFKHLILNKKFRDSRYIYTYMYTQNYWILQDALFHGVGGWFRTPRRRLWR
jgi:hypothetical protein